MSAHPDHTAELHRLNRIRGQIDGVGRMIEAQRYCPDILVQTRAIQSAIRSLERSLLDRHIRHCVSQAFQDDDPALQNARVDELLEIFSKRLSG